MIRPIMITTPGRRILRTPTTTPTGRHLRATMMMTATGVPPIGIQAIPTGIPTGKKLVFVRVVRPAAGSAAELSAASSPEV